MDGWWISAALALGALAGLWSIGSARTRRARRLVAERLSRRESLTPTEFAERYYEMQNQIEVAKAVQDTLVQVLPVCVSGIRPDDRFVDDLAIDAIDSLAQIELVTQLEQRLGIDIPDHVLAEVETVQELIELITDIKESGIGP